MTTTPVTATVSVQYHSTPLERTRAALDVSVTELGLFRTCHRKWALETVGNLTPRVPESFSVFEFGTGIHAGLEAYYQAKILENDAPHSSSNDSTLTPEEVGLEAFKQWYTMQDLVVSHDHDLPTETRDALAQELFELCNLGTSMLGNYFTYAEGLDDKWDILAVEGELLRKMPGIGSHISGYSSKSSPRVENGRVLCPIVNPRNHRVLPGSPVLSGRLDLIVQRNDYGTPGTWIVDHKTTSSAPSDRGIDFEDQITGYCYLLWRLTGIIPQGVIFNYLVKQLPKSPRRNKTMKNGSTLSTAKDQLCLPTTYRAEMVKDDLINSDGTITSEEHADCYAALLSSGWARFFARNEVHRNLDELLNYEERLYLQYRDMRRVRKTPKEAYPNLSMYNVCPRCAVAPVCQAMEDGSDVEDITTNRFMQAQDRKA